MRNSPMNLLKKTDILWPHCLQLLNDRVLEKPY